MNPLQRLVQIRIDKTCTHKSSELDFLEQFFAAQQFAVPTDLLVFPG
jgi:hypothetical protein